MELPAGRTKPWGTGQAVLACKEVLHEPFVVINADDYYGKEAFVKLHDFLVGYTPEKASQFCMAGFILKNTLSENGAVTRGICETNEEEQVRLLQEIPSEENLWQAVIAFQDYPFKTATGLPFRYKLKVGKNGEYNKELLIDRREKSKSLAWSNVVLAFENSKRISEEVKKPKALGDIRGVSYIYPILWRFGLLRVPEAIEKKMGK